ncbi:hypothetical protein ACFVAJ_17590 [Agromyces sp. NPDC057679]|uniref:hypothetical protein n=1 Tax=Agromyces sp. NPDC057679 TaxID=3346207 RepID=UPI00366BE483
MRLPDANSGADAGELDLAPIKERLDYATPGPWRREYHGHNEIMAEGGWQVAEKVTRADDTAFIAAARDDIPALISEVERLRAGN